MIAYFGLIDGCFFVSLTTKLSIDCLRAGAIVGFKVTSSALNDGRSKALGLTGSRIFGGSGSGSSSITFGAGFSGSTGLTFECFDS